MQTSQEFRIPPELRRCCWYVILSMIALAAAFYWVARFVQNRDPANIALGVVFFALVAGAMWVGLRWRVRLDDNGVSRRLFIRWDLWSWNDLASGRIEKLYPFTLRDPDRPRWRRKLRLGLMSPEDTQTVFASINEHYRLPPPPTLPPALTIRYGFRRTVTLDNYGVQLLVGRTPYECRWRDIRGVSITRMEPLRRDFKSLLIALPDQEIELNLVTHQGGTSPTWRGATAAEINELLLKNVSKDRIHVSIAGQLPTSRERIEKDLRTAQKSVRDVKIMLAIFLPLILGLLVWFAIEGGLLKAAVMSLGFVAPAVMMVYLYRLQMKRIGELTERLPSAGRTS
jgi:hypothetical protein